MQRLVFLLLWGLLLQAQPTMGPANPEYHAATAVPSQLVSSFRAMGDRMQKPGKERLTLQGTLSAEGAVSPAQIVLEKGGKVRLSAPGRLITFDGKPGLPALSESDRGVLESLSDDSAETFFDLVANGAVPSLVGQRFPDGAGGRCDLYDMPVRGKTKGDRVQIKRYCLSSSTGLLTSVRYVAVARGPVVETRFSDWKMIDGQAVPGTISRSEGGRQVFEFKANPSGISVSAKATDATFAK